jgi:hypothetical protein
MFLPYFCTPKENHDKGNFFWQKTSFELVAQLVEHPDYNREGSEKRK